MGTEALLATPAYSIPRRWPRYKLNVPVRVIVTTPVKTAIVDGRGTELNEGGLAVFAGVELRVSDTVAIEFTPPYTSQPLRARAVVRNRNGYSYGMEFLEDSSEDAAWVLSIREVLRAMGSPVV